MVTRWCSSAVRVRRIRRFRLRCMLSLFVMVPAPRVIRLSVMVFMRIMVLFPATPMRPGGLRLLVVIIGLLSVRLMMFTRLRLISRALIVPIRMTLRVFRLIIRVL